MIYYIQYLFKYVKYSLKYLMRATPVGGQGTPIDGNQVDDLVDLGVIDHQGPIHGVEVGDQMLTQNWPMQVMMCQLNPQMLLIHIAVTVFNA